MADASQYLANVEAMATDQLKEQAGLLGLADKEEGEAAVGEKEVVGEASVGGSEENIKMPEGVGEKKLEGAEGENEGARSTVGFESMGKEEEISKGDIGDGAERVKEEVDKEKKEELEEETKEEILPGEKVEGLRKEEDGIKTREDQNRKEESSEEPVDSLDCLKQKDEKFEIETDKEQAQLDITDQRSNDEDLDKLKDIEEVAENIQSSEGEKNIEGILKETNKETIEEPEQEELEKSHSNYSTVIFRI